MAERVNPADAAKGVVGYDRGRGFYGATEATPLEYVEYGDKEERERHDKMVIQNYAEVAQAMAAGMGEEGFQVVMQPPGSCPSVDIVNKVINLPQPEGSTYEQLVLARGFIDHELGHVRWTDKTKTGKNKLNDYLANMLEDGRIDKMTCKQYPGCKVNLRELLHHFDKRTAEMDYPPTMNPRVVEGLKDFTEFMTAYYSETIGLLPSIRPENKLIDIFEKIRKMDMRSTRDCLRLAEKLGPEIRKRILLPEPEEKPKKKKGKGEDGGGEEGEGDESSGEGKGEGKGKGKGKPGKGGKGAPDPGSPFDDYEKESSEEESEDGEGTGDESEEDGEKDGKKPTKGKGAGKSDEKDEKGEGAEGKAKSDEKADDETKPEDKAEGKSKGEGDKDEKDEKEGDAGGKGGDAEDEDDDSEGDDADDDDDEDLDEPGSAARSKHGTEKQDHGEKKYQEYTDGIAKEPEEYPEEDLKAFDDFLRDHKKDFDLAGAIEGEFKPIDEAAKAPDFYRKYTVEDKTMMFYPRAEYPRMKKLMDDSQAAYGRVFARMVRMYKQVAPAPVRNQEKGMIDGGRLYRAVALGAADIFTRKMNVEKFDIAYELLLDLSGSMNGTRLNLAFQTAVLLGQSMHALNIPFEITGFTTFGGDSPGISGYRRTIPLRHYVFKPFHERMSWKVYGRLEVVLAEYGRTCHNVDGEGVEWAAKRLMTRKEKKKVLLVLSDGLPEDGMGSAALCNHLKKMVKEYSRHVSIVAIGIQTTAPKQFYKNNVCITDVNELPVQAMDQIEKFIKNTI